MNARLEKRLRPAPSAKARGSNTRGFTLVELMITIAVAGILLGMGIPSFVSFVAGQQVRTASSDLATMLMYARSEAIKRNASVVAEPVSSAWRNGWTVSATIGGTATVLMRHEAVAATVNITGPDSVTYTGEGRLSGTTAPSFALTSTKTTRASTIDIELSGMPKITSQN